MALDNLLYLQGIGDEYVDYKGEHVVISDVNRQGVLRSLMSQSSQVVDEEEIDLPLTDEQIQTRIDELAHHPWTLPLPRFQYCYLDELKMDIILPVEYQDGIKLSIVSPQGQLSSMAVTKAELMYVEEHVFDEQLYIKYRIHFSNTDITPRLVLGYHQVSIVLLTHSSKRFIGCLMVAPRQAFSGYFNDAHLQKRAKPWGVNIQLYSLRSGRQWGIGDFIDLYELITILAKKGADFILLNPLHALDIKDPEQASPYSPTDRRRINPLYIGIDSVKEFAYVKNQIEKSQWGIKVDNLNETDWVDYSHVFSIKYQAFVLLYKAFCEHEQARSTSRYQAFQSFISEEGQALQEFVLREEVLFSDRNNGMPVDATFFCYLQFIAQEQLRSCQVHASALGMSIGLIRDLAVGAKSKGAEVGAHLPQYATKLSVGAPPDNLAPQGQNWCLTPFDPIKLQQSAFEPFIQLVHQNMRDCGGLRIDHVVGLLRLWCRPINQSRGEGAYVYYPMDTLIAIINLESQLAQCCVIGEDLGLIPDELTQAVSNAGFYANEVFYFCKDWQGFYAPKDYKKQSLMMLANHDVPTLAAWWSSSDLHLRFKLSLLDSEDALATLLHRRNEEKQQLLDILIWKQLLPSNVDMDSLAFSELLMAWVSLSASGASQLFSVQLCDLLADIHGVNIPGTWQEYPNWQRKLTSTLASLEQDERFLALLDVIHTCRNQIEE
ncbi:4-alpha-glucanotransferase [uncultured Shewanella sp.]|uniref:4-alpha-glucanotransferase n=1 Tax=uncultured Shewanella sp. TaxID=173975 RepID=UPI0026297C61|nr:4-alpha-glucanotransferase [uncultured Shewanella sp.]